MPDRRVICDSEDEDAGFSPVNSPLKADATRAGVALDDEDDMRGQPPHEGLDVSEVRSTDPDFFRRVYDDQQNVANEVVPDSARDSDLITGSSDRPKNSKQTTRDNSSSITDPGLISAKRKGRRVNGLNVSPLTQVTTPRDGAPVGLRKNVYDFPSSDDEVDSVGLPTLKDKAKATKSRSKRKRSQDAAPAETAVRSSPPRSSSQSEGLVSSHPRHEGESPQPSKKKRKSGTQQGLIEISEEVDLLAIPRTAEMSESPAKTRDGQEDLGSMVPDTFKEEKSVAEHPPASFFIAPPSRLTASQKQEYVPISGSSENEGEEPHGCLLAVPQAGTQGQKLRSSEATIAYTTPSRYCSSAPPFPDPQETGGRDSSGTAASSRKRANITRESPIPPHSSPDELNSNSPEHTLPRTKRQRGRYQHGNIAQEDPEGSDTDEIPREKYAPRPSRRSNMHISNKSSEKAVLPDAESGSTRKKRMQTTSVVDVAQDDSWNSDKIGAHREIYKPRPSRRRSRAVLEDTENVPEQSMPDTCPPGQANPGVVETAEPILISSGKEAPQDREDERFEGIDPDYLAALPKELRQEVIADHLARNSQASRTRGRGRPKQLSSGLDAPPEELPQPKKRGRKKKEPASEVTPAPDTEAQATSASIAPAKKKRGRPRKSDIVQPEPAAGPDEDISLAYELGDMPQAVDDSTADDALTLESVPDVPEQSKAPSKRGRKKKVLEKPPANPDQEPFEPIAEDRPPGEYAETASDRTRGPAKRGRKRKVVEDPPAALIEELQEEADTAELANMEVDESAESPLNKPVEPVEAMPLQDISNSAFSKDPSLLMKGEEEMSERDAGKEGLAPEARTKDISKNTSSTTAQGQGKVPYRVGLSKRSRIAPLLKIIRK